MTQLAELRKAAGLTQKELARKVKVSQPNISAWERGLPMGKRTREKLAKALKTSVSELL